MNFPGVDNVIHTLRNNSCGECKYCNSELDPKKYLGKYFGYSDFRMTVVISPLQSLMKDQVDNLSKRGIAEAVTINGLLSPIERAESGIASILYISPESLRSVAIESSSTAYAGFAPGFYQKSAQ